MIRTSTLFLFAVLISSQLHSQTRKKVNFNKQNISNKQGGFLEKQWWIGLKGGINLTQAVPLQRYSVLSGTSNYPSTQLDKKYNSLDKVGSQATLEVTFYFKGFSFSFQPTYRHSLFTYSNQFEWTDTETVGNRLILNYNQENIVDYADLPLLVKYDITKTKLRPYLQAGAFYSLMVNATKSVKVEGIDYASGGTNQFSNEPLIVGATDLFHNSYWGLIAGAGADYNLGNVRLILDVSYRMGMSNITNTENRYSNDRLSGIGDAMDDLTLNNIVISAGCLFPLRFLGTGFKTLDK
ncbi:hypothetical protein BH09BAC3_BH09BAC3_23290 [soil metagenome]